MGKSGLIKLHNKRLLTIAMCALLCVVLILTLFPSSVEAKKDSTKEDLRGVVSQVNSLNIAVVDEATPLSSIDGKDMLLVDGNSYPGSNAKVQKLVQAEALGSTPVVFIGSGFEEFCASLGICFQDAQGSNGDELPIAANVVKILPRHTSEGKLVPAYFTVPGDSNQVTLSELQSITDWCGSVDSLQLNTLTDTLPSVVGGVQLMSSGSYWELVHVRTYSSVNEYEHYGRMNITLQTFKLMDDVFPNDVYYYTRITKQMVPGDIIWESEWFNDYSWIRCDVDAHYFGAGQELIDYAPTTTIGYSSVSVSVGGGIPGGIYGSETWAYSVEDVRVYDYGDMGIENAEWRHNIDQDKDVGHHTYKMEPGLCWRVPENHYFAAITPYFKVRFAKKHQFFWTWWETYTSGETGLPIVLTQ